MLEVRNVNHSFGRTQVLHDCNFTVNSGEILGFLGPNGAGKSSTMRIITGYLRPSTGQVLFEGVDVRQKPVAVRRHLGYLPESVPLYPELTVREYLQWVARIKRSASPREQTGDVMERCGLADVSHKLIHQLSKGYKQRVGLAQAILGETRLLILDEPTVGLDPAQIRDIRDLIKELGREKTILLSTHILPEVELTCDRVLIINKGRIVAEDTPDSLVHRFGGQARHLLRLALPPEEADLVARALNDQPFVRSVTPRGLEFGGLSFEVETDTGQDYRAPLSLLVFQQGWPLLEFKPADISLEDAFVNLVRHESEHMQKTEEIAA